MLAYNIRLADQVASCDLTGAQDICLDDGSEALLPRLAMTRCCACAVKPSLRPSQFQCNCAGLAEPSAASQYQGMVQRRPFAFCDSLSASKQGGDTATHNLARDQPDAAFHGRASPPATQSFTAEPTMAQHPAAGSLEGQGAVGAVQEVPSSELRHPLHIVSNEEVARLFAE